MSPWVPFTPRFRRQSLFVDSNERAYKELADRLQKLTSKGAKRVIEGQMKTLLNKMERNKGGTHGSI